MNWRGIFGLAWVVTSLALMAVGIRLLELDLFLAFWVGGGVWLGVTELWSWARTGYSHSHWLQAAWRSPDPRKRWAWRLYVVGQSSLNLALIAHFAGLF